jgi:hypothetical protein
VDKRQRGPAGRIAQQAVTGDLGLGQNTGQVVAEKILAHLADKSRPPAQPAERSQHIGRRAARVLLE